MSQRLINIGAGAGAGDAETLRSAFNKINQNFTELYDGNVVVAGNVLVQSVAGRIGDVELSFTDVAGAASVGDITNIKIAMAANSAADRAFTVSSIESSLSTGYTGSIGYTGSQGITGYTGSVGDVGYTGSIGYTGSVGIGYTGSQGSTGYVGSNGDRISKFHDFGGQLAKFKSALVNPLEQFTGVVFIGDSITWGLTLPDNPVYNPRDGTLSDPRDNFTSNSWVNITKRYIGNVYYGNTSPVISNWSASTSGEAIATYSKTFTLYPFDGDFTIANTGASLSMSESANVGSITGFQKSLTNANSLGTSYHSIFFTFTGTEFTLCFGSNTDGSDYELFVDSVSQGVFVTRSGEDGLTVGNDRRRTHTFSYIRNKVIEIRSVYREIVPSAPNVLRIEAIIVNKTIRLTNQGIIGTSSRVYKTYNLAGNGFGDGEAVGAYDNFVFIQIGTNDRIIRSDVPTGVNQFKKYFSAMLAVITPLADVICLAANPVTNESTATYSFTMADVRAVIYDYSRDNSLDMIDNYAAFYNLDLGVYTADGTHPNALGHPVIFENIRGAIEQSYTVAQGAIGYTGSQGNIGYTGSQGVIGYTGSVGYTGSSGNPIPRANTQTTTTTLTPQSSLYEQYSITALASNLSILSDSSTPQHGQKMVYHIKDDSTPRYLTFATGTAKSFREMGTTLPTVTVSSKNVYIACIYNAVDSRWDVVAVSQEI